MPEASFGRGPDLAAQAAALGLNRGIPRGPVGFVRAGADRPVPQRGPRVIAGSPPPGDALPEKDTPPRAGTPTINTLPSPAGSPTETRMLQAQGPAEPPRASNGTPAGPDGQPGQGDQQVESRTDAPAPPVVPPEARTERAGGGDACGEIVADYNAELAEMLADEEFRQSTARATADFSPFWVVGLTRSNRLLSEAAETRNWSDIPADEREAHEAMMLEAERTFLSLTESREPIRVTGTNFQYFEPIFMGNYPVLQDNGQMADSPVVVQPIQDGTPGITGEYKLDVYQFDAWEASGEPSITNDRYLGFMRLDPSGFPARSNLEYITRFQRLAQQANDRQRAAAEQAETAGLPGAMPAVPDGEATDPESTDGGARPGAGIPLVTVVSEPGDHVQSHVEPFAPLPTPVPEVERGWSQYEDLRVGAVAIAPRIGPYTSVPDNPERFYKESDHALLVEVSSPEEDKLVAKISLDASQRATQVFSREAHFHAIASGATQGVPRLIEAGTLMLPTRVRGDQPFGTLIMDLIPGVDLLEFQQENPAPLTIPEAIARYMPLAETVDAVGQAGLVHRDIKRANVVLDPDGVPHLVDFSVATTAGTRTNVRWGAPLTRPPEQEMGNIMTAETNVFPFGLLVLHEITREGSPIPYQRGRTPSPYRELLQSGNYTEHLQQWLAEHNVPVPLRTPFMRVLAENPADRPTAVEFMRELEAANR